MGLRGALLVSFLLAVSFAYTDPPISEVMGHNFDSSFLESLANNVPEGVVLDPEHYPGHEFDPVYFNATLIGVFPSVEDRVPADAGIYQILWMWGEEYNNTVHYDSINDSDGDTHTDVYLTMDEIQYSFKIKVDNETVIWRFPDEPPSDIAYFNLSLSPEQMEKYNATERMEVLLEYSATYVYKTVGSSGDELQVIVEEGGHTELYYYVENGNVTFFTVRPVLGEQWYRNNHFDNLVFSKKRFYKSELYLDGNLVGSARILNFSIYTGAGGAWFINSSVEEVYGNSTLYEYGMVYTPIPMIADNESFRYLYEENYSYSGIGRHNLTLVLTDDFLHTYEYNRTLLSRAAGEQEAAEEGADCPQGGAECARPTYEKPDESLTQVIIPTGALAIIFIIVLASTWWGYGRERRWD